jgi:benzoyl-CoA reductase/2-hydroxyglutaryl-CoA dehydratase subunit BcrC/BadD/HgdB
MMQLGEMMEARQKALSLDGRPVIGWCCSYVPIEIVESLGLVPYRVLPVPPVDMGDAYLNPNFCPYVRAVMGESLAGAYPFLSGLIVVNTCDGMRRLYDGWSHFHGSPFLHLMDLPRITTPEAVQHFREEIKDLAERMSAHFGVTFTKETTRACFEASNRTHRLVQQVQQLMAEGRLAVPASEVMDLFRAGGVLPRSQYNLLLEHAVDACLRRTDRSGIPILLTGAMLENVDILSMIEAAGGRVAIHDLCVSGRQSEDPLSLTEDPLTALANYYLFRPPCARMQETARRIDYIRRLVRGTRVQGVIDYVLKFCDTFLYEVPILKTELDRLGIPMLTIESEYRKGQGGGVQTRIEAFMEMLSGTGNPQPHDWQEKSHAAEAPRS